MKSRVRRARSSQMEACWNSTKSMGRTNLHYFIASGLIGLALVLSGCSAIASRNNSGVVVSRSAQIRSSTAVVAADLLEVTRGDTVDILDSIDIPDPSDNSKRERWYRVRGDRKSVV